MSRRKAKGKGGDKHRASFRKKHELRRRKRDVTREYLADDDALHDTPQSERVSGKGELSRKRTVRGAVVASRETSGFEVLPEVDLSTCLPGRVLAVYGLKSRVELDDGRTLQCTTRRLLKTLSTDERHVVVAGDRVMVRPANQQEGMIERIEPRTTALARTVRGKRHVLVANIEQMFIIGSLAQPVLKPNLVDRFLVAAEAYRIAPVVCFNKIDLVEPAEFVSTAGVYGQLGYPVLFLSAETGAGIERLRAMIVGRRSVVVGQSGVGKSSLLNAVEPGLGLRVRAVSRESEKGRHTTTAARLVRLAAGGYILDTPGIRQWQLWDVNAEEIAGYFREFRPYVSHCRFPDCTHVHEEGCAVKAAVGSGHIDLRRYDSYCHLVRGD